MRKKRKYTEGAFYHVTSRTNNKIRVFENRLGRKIMLMTLQDAKDKFHFCLTNFCIMPTHFHLLIRPEKNSCLSVIMQWIKTNSAKRWNNVHGSKDHLWGHRYFARAIKNPEEYESVMEYIDQNAVKAGLASIPADWKASGAYYKIRNITGFVDFTSHVRQPNIKLLSPVPPIVSRLIPPAQLDHTIKFFGTYVEDIDRLYKLVPTIPRLGESVFLNKPLICLHYFSDTTDYFIYEYDGEDIMYGLMRSNVNTIETKYSKISLSILKINPYTKLDYSWSA